MTTFKCLEKYFGLHWPGWLNVIIWGAVIIALFSETIRNFIPLLDDYRNNNNGTQIGVIKDEYVDRPVDMTICVPYYSSEIESIVEELTNNWIENNTLTCDTRACRAMKRHSWDVWSQMSMPFKFGESAVTYQGGKSGRNKIHKLFVQIPAAIMRRLLREDNVFDSSVLNLTERNFNWNQPIVDAVWYYFTCLSGFDILFLVNTDRSLQMFDEDDCRIILNSTSFVEKNSSIIDKLYEKLLRAIETFTVAGFDSDKFAQPTLNDRHGVTVWDGKLCYATFPSLQSDRIIFRNYFNKYDDDSAPPPWTRLNPREAAFQIYGDSTPLYTLPDSANAVYNGFDHAEDITIFYSIQSRVVDKRDGIVCSSENTPALCVAKSQLEYVTYNFHCVPFALRHLWNDTGITMPYCDLSIYSNDLNETETRRSAFRALCENRCAYIFAQWKTTISTRTPLASENQSGLIMDLVARPSVFIEFRLVDQNTFQQFLSQVGGIANLYLGLSGLTACTVIIFLIDLCKRRRLLRKNSGHPPPSPPPVVGWNYLFYGRTFINSLKDRTRVDAIRIENENLEKEIDNIVKEFKEYKSANDQVVEILSRKLQSVEDKYSKESIVSMNRKNDLKKRNSLT